MTLHSTFFPFDGHCSQIAWSPNGQSIAVVDSQHETWFIYDLNKKMRLPWMLFPEHQQTAILEEDVYSLAWSPKSSALALGGSGQLTIVDPFTGSVLAQVHLSERSYSSFVPSLAWSPTGKILALTTGHERCLFYDVAHKVQAPQVLSCSSNSGSDRATFVHGWIGRKKSIAVASKDRTLMTIDPVSKRTYPVSTDGDIPCPSCAVSPSGRSVALTTHLEVALYTVGHAEPGLRKVNIYQPEPCYQPDHKRQEDERWYALPPSLVAWSQDGKYIATSFGTLKKRIYIWETTTGMTRHVLETAAQQEEVLSLTWGPDGFLCWGGQGYLQISQIL